MTVNTFTKAFDEVVMIKSVLKRLKSADLSSLNERIRCQKLQYLAQIFRVSPVYSFNLYLRGPYSRDLTRDLFAAQEEVKVSGIVRFASEELEERFLKLQKFVEPKNIRELELITTYYWLRNEAKLSEENASKKIHELKSTSNEELQFVQDAIKEIQI